MTDFFTVLVTVLLVYSISVQLLPPPQSMTLPTSTARDNLEHQAVAIMLTHDQILVNGTPVISYQQVLASKQETIPALAVALAQAAKSLDRPKTVAQSAPPPAAKTPDAATDQPAPLGRGRVAIMADKELPYRLIRKVLLTTTATEFGRISLAVLQEEQ
ncbi:MAG: biopolymer transporter ExbD [Salinisphaera sp.]|nr:biopolymer transporter ExbD [Salinisphaera sp.]